jgi:hypothetical protein
MPSVERIVSAHSLWLFDTDRKRFRRIPRDADPDAPTIDADWEPYFDLVVEESTGAFTVTLNEDGTRLLRSFRIDDEQPAPQAREDHTTTELRIDRRDLP